MEERILGRTGRAVSVAGLGTWQLGADWGDVAEADALGVLDAAAQAGVTFLDTADVYGDGRSERRPMTASQAKTDAVPSMGLTEKVSGVTLSTSQPSPNASRISSRRTRRGPHTPGWLSLKHIM